MNLNTINCKQNFNGLMQIRIGSDAQKPQGIAISNIEDSYMNMLSKKHGLKKGFNFGAQYDPKCQNYILELAKKINIDPTSLGELYFISNDSDRVFVHAEKAALDFCSENFPKTQEIRKALDFIF